MNDIIDCSTFTYNKREIVIKAIRRLDPEFQPVYTAPELKYKNCLLDSLNENVQPIEQNDFPVMNVNKKLILNLNVSLQSNGSEILNDRRSFSLDDYQRMFDEQLAVELAGSVKIKSIEKFNDVNSDVLLYVSFFSLTKLIVIIKTLDFIISVPKSKIFVKCGVVQFVMRSIEI